MGLAADQPGPSLLLMPVVFLAGVLCHPSDLVQGIPWRWAPLDHLRTSAHQVSTMQSHRNGFKYTGVSR